MAIDLEKAKELVTAEMHASHVTIKSQSLNKNISWATFITLILPFLGRTAGEFDTIMPEHACYMSKGPDKMFISLYIPAHVRKVTFDPRGTNGLREFTIPLPNIVAEYDLTKGSEVWSVANANFFMTKESRLQTSLWYRGGMRIAKSLGDNLRNFAVVSLPNIYEGGTMCTGENSVAANLTDNNLSGLDSYIDILLNQPFSRDLSIRSVNRSGHSGSEDWLELLATKTTFPYELTTLG